MLQTVMLLGLGFLAASLVAFLLAPFLWRYAVHVTKQHIRQTSPLTMGEIQSDRDQLRAEHALRKRKLEIERDKLGEANKILKIEIAEMKKRMGEISLDIHSHGSEIKTKDSALDGLAKERDRLKITLSSTQKDLKEAKSKARREKNLSARSASALKEANGLVKTKESEIRSLKKSLEKIEKQFKSNAEKLKTLEGHISRAKTCTGAIKSLGGDLLQLEKQGEKFLGTAFSSKKDFTAAKTKILKNISAFSTLENSVRKQYTIASKAQPGGRPVFTPLKQQIDYLKSSAAMVKKIIENTEYRNTKADKTSPEPAAEHESRGGDITERIRSLQDKLSA